MLYVIHVGILYHTNVKFSDVSRFYLYFFQHLCTPLHTACSENEDSNIIALILKCKDVDVNATDEVRGYDVS